MEIIFKDVTKSMGGRNIITKLTQKFVSGKVYILRGENGRGKTTLLKLAAHFISPTSGEVTVSKSESFPLKGREYQNLAAFYTPEAALYGTLTAKENLKFFAALSGKNLTDNEISDFFTRVGLKEEELENKLSVNLSTGMKARVKFAILFACNSPIWLLDEPCANLDDAGRLLIINEVKQAAQTEKIVLWATNDEREFGVADTIIDL